MTDFTKLRIDQIADYLVANQADLDAGGISREDVLVKVASGKAVIETRAYGFAVIEEQRTADGVIPHLWILYVAPEHRGRGFGYRFMKELLRKYPTHHMSLYCFGPRRRKFFGRLGFRVQERDGECRRMTTNPDRH